MTNLSTPTTQRKHISKTTKQKVLDRCDNMCVCCGQKLTPKTATIDHVVPLSRGGENDIKNYVTLCKKCNQIKANDIYPPPIIYRQFYGENISPKMIDLRSEITDYFFDWFDRIYKDFPVKTNPLIAPTSVILYQTNAKYYFDTQRHKKNASIIHKYKVNLITKNNKDEMEKQTKLFFQNIINDTHQLAYGDRKRKDPVAIYTIDTINAKNNIKMVFSVATDTEHNRLILYCPYSTLDKITAIFVAEAFLENLTTILNECLHIRIDQLFCFASQKLEYIFEGIVYTRSDIDNFNMLPCVPVTSYEGIAPGIKDKRNEPIPLTLTLFRFRFNDQNQPKANRKTDFYDTARLTQDDFKKRYKNEFTKEEMAESIEISNAHRDIFNKNKRRANKLYNQQKQSKANKIKNKTKKQKQLTNKQKKKQNMTKMAKKTKKK